MYIQCTCTCTCVYMYMYVVLMGTNIFYVKCLSIDMTCKTSAAYTAFLVAIIIAILSYCMHPLFPSPLPPPPSPLPPPPMAVGMGIQLRLLTDLIESTFDSTSVASAMKEDLWQRYIHVTMCVCTSVLSQKIRHCILRVCSLLGL